MDGQADNLRANADAMCQDPAFRHALRRHCAYIDAMGDIARLNTLVHPGDQMLQHSLNGHREVNRAVSQYFNVALQQHSAVQQILNLLFEKPKDQLEILDFACGYGRLLRFLCLCAPPARIWASDIQRDAVDFVAREFGVNGLYSDFDPEQFEPGRKFDFIWVASLFSHLPAHLFHRWLARLFSLLKPGGVLCFSVHDERLLPGHFSMPAEGLYFQSNSENADLDNSVYGTSFVSESFVRSAIVEVAGNIHPYFRVKRGLANEQDIYVVSRDRDRDLGPLMQMRKGPWGWVDECKISDTAELTLSGWAASIDDGALDSIEITVDGKAYTCPTGVIRDDVRSVLGDDRLVSAGWEFKLALDREASEVFLEVTARARPNEIALLYAGKLPIPKHERIAKPRRSIRDRAARRLELLMERFRR
jgi:SAM-dependent methyltransferase